MGKDIYVFFKKSRVFKAVTEDNWWKQVQPHRLPVQLLQPLLTAFAMRKANGVQRVQQRASQI